jgi:hypothetical protein
MTTSLAAYSHHTSIIRPASSYFFPLDYLVTSRKTPTFATKCNNVVGSLAFSKPDVKSVLGRILTRDLVVFFKQKDEMNIKLHTPKSLKKVSGR